MTQFPRTDCFDEIPLVPDFKTPSVVDRGGRQYPERCGESYSNGISYQLTPHCASLCLAPSCDIRLVGDQSCSVAHSRVDGIYPEPAARRTGRREMAEPNLALGVNHAKHEQSEDSRNHNGSLEPEELGKLVGSEKGQWQVD